MLTKLELFEDLSFYKIDLPQKQYLSHHQLLPLGILIDGINDFQSFSYQIQDKANSLLEVINIFNELYFILFNIRFDYFDKQYKPNLILSHYNIYSIYLKKCFLPSVLHEFSSINEKYFYIYLEDNNYSSSNKFHSPKAKDVKFSFSNPKKFLFGFDNYKDSIDFYVDLVKIKKKWPVFVIYPTEVNYDKNNIVSKTNEIIESHKIYSYTNKSQYPVFSPIQILHYFSFIEKNPPKPKRMMNVTENYSINKIEDVQISHISSNSKSKGLSIRTFLGFESKFRCFHAFDYLLHNNNEIFDLKFVDENEKSTNSIKYEFYYLELRSIFDSSSLFSINYIESFIFFNDYDDVYSTFLSFDNQEDFLFAKQMLSSLISNDYVFKNMKIIDKEDISLIFPSIQIQLDMFYIMFRLKCLNTKKLPNFSFLFRGSVIIKKNVICTLDKKMYIIVGFADIKKRNNSFQLLKQSMYLVTLKSYYPENIKIDKDKKDIRREDINISKSKNMYTNIFMKQNNNKDLEGCDIDSIHRKSINIQNSTNVCNNVSCQIINNNSNSANSHSINNDKDSNNMNK